MYGDVWSGCERLGELGGRYIWL